MKVRSFLRDIVNEVQPDYNNVKNLTSVHHDYNVELVSLDFDMFHYVLKQINAGAVMLTDCVYWLIIFPFLTLRDYDLNFVSTETYFLLSHVLHCATY